METLMNKTITFALAFASTACVGGLSFGAGDKSVSDPSDSSPLPTADKDGDYTLAQKKFIKGSDKYFKRSVDSYNKRCETKIDAAIVWPTWIEVVDEQIKTNRGPSIHGYCAETLDVLAYMCHNDADAKAVIVRKVSSYRCEFGGEGKRAMTLSKKNLAMWVDFKAKNSGDYINGWLGDNL